MTRPNLVVWFVAGMLTLASVVAWALTPTKRMTLPPDASKLEQLVPEKFGGWTIDPTIRPVQVSPDVQAALDKTYSQTISRTYVNESGERVMLSVAYGGDQSRTMAVHRPEVCYAAQGFAIRSAMKTTVATSTQQIPAMHLVAELGQRTEPITYWIRIGDRTVRGNVEQGLARLALGLKGYVPDGILVRVSTIDRDSDRAFALQRQFIEDMMSAVPANQRATLVGTAS